MVIKKLNTACFQMCVLRNGIDLTTKLIVHDPIFFPILHYGIELWGTTPYVTTVLKIQNKYLRVLSLTLNEQLVNH